MRPLDRHAELVEALRQAVFDSAGATSPDVRASAATGRRLLAPLDDYAADVRESSYRVTDGDIAGLRAAGHTEEEIFEVTVAAALGAALRRLEGAMRAVRGEA